ncbi:shikimate dehydrogenase [Candidatus Aerophobetes bacterium]|nr:shikimate dehydrogenase [Candidatus Aerophobetes bacterium]
MKITGKTKIVGLFGYPVTHSLSPLIHNAAFEKAGLNFIYLAFPVKSSNLGEATRAIKALEMVGVNVTIPHKQKIIQYLDELSPEANVVGAINTVVNREGKLAGYNTDGEGFAESLREKSFSLKGKHILLLGAGGAALAISFSLLKEKPESLILTNRTLSRAKDISKKLASSRGEVKMEIVEFERRNSLPRAKEIDLLINTTSLGMQEGHPAPINLEQFSSSLFVYDVIYNRETELLNQAKRLGMRYQGGLDMLIFQAALSFEIWTGRKAPVDEMREALMR